MTAARKAEYIGAQIFEQPVAERASLSLVVSNPEPVAGITEQQPLVIAWLESQGIENPLGSIVEQRVQSARVALDTLRTTETSRQLGFTPWNPGSFVRFYVQHDSQRLQARHSLVRIEQATDAIYTATAAPGDVKPWGFELTDHIKKMSKLHPRRARTLGRRLLQTDTGV